MTTAISSVPALDRPPVTTRPILVATDGADGAAALRAARDLAARTGGHPIVLSVVEPPPPLPAGFDGAPMWYPDPELLLRGRRERVARQTADVFGSDDSAPIDVQIDVQIDEPSRGIARVADERQAALIVIGIGRHDLRARLMGGEVTLRVVRRARVPVLAVGAAPLPVPARVAVVGVDFSASSLAAARAALDLLGDGGTLHLVHVWARFPIEYPELAQRDAAYERALPGRFAQLEAALLDQPRAVTVVATSLLGEPADQLLAYARAHGADLVAAGRQGHQLVERLLLGRVTTALLRHATCALLVTPEPSAAARRTLELTLTGTSESRTPSEWDALLEAFTRRNRSRRTTLEVDAPAVGAQTQEIGYTLLGTVYDRHDARVQIMLGLPREPGAHVTRMIPGVRSLAVHTGPDGRDAALRIEHDDGQTLLTFP